MSDTFAVFLLLAFLGVIIIAQEYARRFSEFK